MNRPTGQRIASASLLGHLLLAYGILLAAGFFVFRSEGLVYRGAQLSVDRAVFAAVNVGTLTGFRQTTGIDQYQTFGQITVLALTLGASLFSLLAGGLAALRVLRVSLRDDHVLIAAVLWLAVPTALGTMALVAGNGGVLDSLILSASALGNSGLSSAPLPPAASWQTLLVLMPLATLGGLGLPVLIELWSAAGVRRLSEHTWTVLTWSAGVFLAGFVLLALLGWGETGGIRELGAAAATGAVNSRSAGFPLEHATGTGRTTAWVITLLMAIGAGSAGTAGGIKLTTLAVLARGVRNSLHGGHVGRTFGIAAAWLIAFTGLCFACFLMLLALQPQTPADRLLQLSVSAAGNVGLSHDPVVTTGAGLYVLSATMLLGRVLPVLVLWWMATTTEGADVAVG